MPSWADILTEIQTEAQANPQDNPIDTVRRRHLTALHQHTQRNVIAYYSGFLSKPGIAGLTITDEDKNGFMATIHNMDRSKGLDLILHTPGGNIGATQSIVDYLHKMFKNDIRAVVPQIAMSAGTMLACSCQSILMGLHSNLGPIDPQLRDIATYGVIAEFKRAIKECTADPARLEIWKTIIGQYRPSFLGQCENAIKWSNDFVREQLKNVMFANDLQATQKAAKIVRALTSQPTNRTHDRHIHFDECKRLGLNVELLEAPESKVLQDLVLTVHHCFIFSLMNTPAYKIIENQMGVAFVKLVAQQQIVIQQPQPPSP
jgi:ClpP class serine protease